MNTGPPTASRGWLLALTGAATLGAFGVAVVAFIGSFSALSGFAVETGVATGDNAWTWPVVIDVTILVATASWIARNLRGRPAGYPLRVTFAFVTISVLVNAAHALDPLTGQPRAAAAMTLAALLPIALAVCVHLVVVELHDLLAPAPNAHTPGGRVPDREEAGPGRRPDVPGHSVSGAPGPADTGPDSTADTDAGGMSVSMVASGSPDAVDPIVAAPATPDAKDLAIASVSRLRPVSSVPGLDVVEDQDVAALVNAYLAAAPGRAVGDAALTRAVADQLSVTGRTARRRLQPFRTGSDQDVPVEVARPRTGGGL